MTGNVIEQYNTFNTKGCHDEVIFGYFNDQEISSNYYNFLNNYDEDNNHVTGTPVDNALLDNKGVEYLIMKNNEDINDEIIIIDDDDSLASDIGALQNEIL